MTKDDPPKPTHRTKATKNHQIQLLLYEHSKHSDSSRASTLRKSRLHLSRCITQAENSLPQKRSLRAVAIKPLPRTAAAIAATSSMKEGAGETKHRGYGRLAHSDLCQGGKTAESVGCCEEKRVLR
jgi:hypothetical protein